MRLKFDFGDSVENADFFKNKILVGSADECDYRLNYEGISRKHLLFGFKKDQLVVKNMSQEFDTYFNGQVFPYNTVSRFHPGDIIEVGGILISEDVSDEEPPKFDSTLNNHFSSEDEVNVEKTDIENSAEDEEESRRKKYRPEIYTPTSLGSLDDSASELSQKVNINTNESDIKSRKKKSKKTRKNRTKTKRKKNTNYSSFLFVTLIAVVFAGVYYYKNFENDHTQAVAKKENLESVFSVRTSNRSKIQSKIDLLKKSYKRKSKFCGSNIEKQFCNMFSLKDKNSGALVFGNELFVFVSRDEILNLESDIYGNESPFNEEELQQIIKTQYAGIVDFERFKQNNLKSSLLLYQTQYNELSLLNALSLKLIGSNTLDLLKASSLNSITVFSYSIFEKELEFNEYLTVKTTNLSFLESFKEDKMKELALHHFHLLTKEMKAVLASIGDSSLYDFDDSQMKQFAINQKRDKLSDLLSSSKCNSNFEKELCDSFDSVKKLSSNEGIVLSDDVLYFLINLDENKNFYRSKNVEYNIQQRKQSLKLYTSLVNSNLNPFKWAKLYSHDTDVAEALNNMLFAASLDYGLFANHIDDLIKNKIKKVQLIGVNYQENGESYLVNSIELVFEESYFRELSHHSQSTVFVWKSNLPVFRDFLKSEKIKLSNF